MSHVEGEDRSEQPNKVRTTNLIRAIYFLALKTQGRRRMDNIHTCRNNGMTKEKKKRKRKTADGLRATYLVTVRVRATVEHALDLAPIALR